MSYLTNPYMVTAGGGAQDPIIWGTFGYCLGGNNGDTGGIYTYKKAIQDIELDADTTGSMKSTIETACGRNCHGQNNTYIYCMGGNFGTTGGDFDGLINDIQEYEIGTTTQAETKAELPDPNSQGYSGSYSSTHSYYFGGNDAYHPSNYSDQIKEFEMETTTNAIDKADLPAIRGNAGSWTDGTYAYCVGGGTSNSNGYTGSSISQYEMGTGTTANNNRDQSLGRAVSCTPQTATHGVCIGGYNLGGTPAHTARVDVYEFGTDIDAVSKGDIGLDTSSNSGAGQSELYGYRMGGGETAGTEVQLGQYIFGTDTAMTNKGTMADRNGGGTGGVGNP